MKTFRSSTGKPATDRDVFLALSDNIDEVPPGWMTRLQWAAHLGMDRGIVGDRLRRLVDAGAAESTTFRIRLGPQVHPVAHYWIHELSPSISARTKQPHGHLDFPTVFPAPAES